MPPVAARRLPRAAYKGLEPIDAGSDWFEVYRIRPGVFAIYEPRQYEEVISYVVLGSRRAALIDTGMGIGRIRACTARLTTLPVTVVNTHTHPDHIGGNAEFQDILGLDTPFSRKNALAMPSAARFALAPGPTLRTWLSWRLGPSRSNPASFNLRSLKVCASTRLRGSRF